MLLSIDRATTNPIQMTIEGGLAGPEHHFFFTVTEFDFHYPNGTDCHGVKNVTQDVFYSSQTSKHRKSSAFTGETAGTSG